MYIPSVSYGMKPLLAQPVRRWGWFVGSLGTPAYIVVEIIGGISSVNGAGTSSGTGRMMSEWPTYDG